MKGGFFLRPSFPQPNYDGSLLGCFFQIAGVEVVNDTVGQSDDRHMNVLGLHYLGYRQEYLGCRHNDIGTVGLQGKLLHTLCRSQGLQLVIEFLQSLYGQARTPLVLLLRQSVQLVYVATRTNDIHVLEVGGKPGQVVLHLLPGSLLYGTAQDTYGTDIVGKRLHQLAIGQQVYLRTSATHVHVDVIARPVLQALEPTYSRNIIKLQIINNQTLFGVHSKSKSF